MRRGGEGGHGEKTDGEMRRLGEIDRWGDTRKEK
jgi:hypothetical protein